MLSSKKYLKKLFIILGIIFISAIGYAYDFSKHYPLPITSHISLDAKIKFIREHIDPDDIDTIIVGSSIGLNNIQGEYLEKSSIACKHVLNLSVYESSTIQVEQVLELIVAFPNLKRIIYSAQFFDIRNSSRFKEFNAEMITRYLRHELETSEYSDVVFNASKNIPFLIERQLAWKNKHTKNNKFTYLGFDKTGSVPLHIYGKDIIEHRWVHPSGVPKYTKKAYSSLGRMMKEAYKKDIKYYLVQQPYRQELIKKHSHLKKALDTFSKKGKKIAEKNNQYFISLYHSLPLSDKYFSDRSHLNDKGSILAAEAIGKFIDQIEK